MNNGFVFDVICVVSFRQKIDIFALPSTSLSSKKEDKSLPIYPFPRIFSNVYLQASSLNKIPIFQELSPIAKAPSPVNKTVSLTFIFGHHHRLAPTTRVSLLTLILHLRLEPTTIVQ
jgi:hypothetical protein